MKTTKNKETSPGEKLDAGLEMLHKGVDDLKALTKKVKKQYNEADDATKKKVVGAIAASAAVLVGLAGLKHLGKKEDEKNN